MLDVARESKVSWCGRKVRISCRQGTLSLICMLNSFHCCRIRTPKTPIVWLTITTCVVSHVHNCWNYFHSWQIHSVSLFVVHVYFKVATFVHQSLSGISVIRGQRLLSCRRCLRVAAAFHSEPNMRRDADIQHLWRQRVLGCWTWTVEQSSNAPERRWLIVQWISVVIKDISVWSVGPWHSVDFSGAMAQCGLQWGHGTVWTLLTAPTRNIHSYLQKHIVFTARCHTEHSW